MPLEKRVHVKRDVLDMHPQTCYHLYIDERHITTRRTAEVPVNAFPSLSSIVPLSEPTFYILLSLVTSEKHGYAILKDVKALSDAKLTLSTSTLYTALNRLLDQRLIERHPDQLEEGSTRRRKVYRLTALGRRVLEAETQRMQVMLSAAHLHLDKGHLA